MEKIRTEARAKIVWGHPPGEVRQWLVAQGMGAAEAVVFVENCVCELAEENRRDGLRELLIGLALFFAAVILGGIMWLTGVWSEVRRARGIPVAVGVLGFLRIGRGLYSLISGNNLIGSTTKV